jgi:hypothetical protein
MFTIGARSLTDMLRRQLVDCVAVERTTVPALARQTTIPQRHSAPIRTPSIDTP